MIISRLFRSVPQAPCLSQDQFTSGTGNTLDVGAYVLDLRDIGGAMLPLSGGKAANLGELSNIKDIYIPEGFCVTTEAYKTVTENCEEFNSLLRLLRPYNSEWIGEVCERIRSAIMAAAIPMSIRDEISGYLAQYGNQCAFAVRSSAFAEDHPEVSFAGQHDTYLNIVGDEAVFKHISMCWASLFTERAVVYRIENSIDHTSSRMAVAVQKMIFPEAAGIIYTADPITSNRRIISIDASFVMGGDVAPVMTDADNYSVRDGIIIKKQTVTAAKRGAQVLGDGLILQLEKAGRAIESYFGNPQNIEWRLADERFCIIQSHPISTLYPLPEKQNDKGHVYMSFGHKSMMTDAMKPLGLSFIQMCETNLLPIGGRLYIDLAHDLASPLSRVILKAVIKKIDPLMEPAVNSILMRNDFMESLERGKRFLSKSLPFFTWELPVQIIKAARVNDLAGIGELMAQNDAFLRRSNIEAEALSGNELMSFIKDSYMKLPKMLYDAKLMGAVYAGAMALNWLNKKMERWLGEKSAGVGLSQSIENNSVGKMGLELLEVADVIRQYPQIIEYLQNARNETFFEDLEKLEGVGNDRRGSEMDASEEAAGDAGCAEDAVKVAVSGFFDKYGMRCSGEIDITRPRWQEEPATLAPVILGNINRFEPGAGGVLLDRSLSAAEQKKNDILARLRMLPFGKYKAESVERKIRVLRNYIDYREYPKRFLMRYYWILKKALLREAGILVQKGVITAAEDIYFLKFDEFAETVRTAYVDYRVIERRKAEYEHFMGLTPPRVMTSEGEALFGEYEKSKLPIGVLPGIAASPGIIEGRARIITKPGDAHIEEGDILVTSYTDPGWELMYVSVNGLVAEVGGFMTYGSVIAREYSLPAVVGVEGATRLIRDGRMIRVNGTEGYVELLT